MGCANSISCSTLDVTKKIGTPRAGPALQDLVQGSISNDNPSKLEEEDSQLILAVQSPILVRPFKTVFEQRVSNKKLFKKAHKSAIPFSLEDQKFEELKAVETSIQMGINRSKSIYQNYGSPPMRSNRTPRFSISVLGMRKENPFRSCTNNVSRNVGNNYKPKKMSKFSYESITNRISTGDN